MFFSTARIHEVHVNSHNSLWIQKSKNPIFSRRWSGEVWIFGILDFWNRWEIQKSKSPKFQKSKNQNFARPSPRKYWIFGFWDSQGIVTVGMDILRYSSLTLCPRCLCAYWWQILRMIDDAVDAARDLVFAAASSTLEILTFVSGSMLVFV